MSTQAKTDNPGHDAARHAQSIRRAGAATASAPQIADCLARAVRLPALVSVPEDGACRWCKDAIPGLPERDQCDACYGILRYAKTPRVRRCRRCRVQLAEAHLVRVSPLHWTGDYHRWACRECEAAQDAADDWSRAEIFAVAVIGLILLLAMLAGGAR